MTTPIPMLIYCPMCCERHIDEGEFATKSHHTHACQKCGHVWRPAIEPTVGVRFLPGFKNAESEIKPKVSQAQKMGDMALYAEEFANYNKEIAHYAEYAASLEAHNHELQMKIEKLEYEKVKAKLPGKSLNYLTGEQAYIELQKGNRVRRSDNWTCFFEMRGGIVHVCYQDGTEHYDWAESDRLAQDWEVV